MPAAILCYQVDYTLQAELPAELGYLHASFRREAYEKTNPVAGEGWVRSLVPGMLAWGIAERVDDFCATAYVCCREPQPVPPLDVAAAIADIERKPYEATLPTELLAGVVNPAGAATDVERSPTHDDH